MIQMNEVMIALHSNIEMQKFQRETFLSLMSPFAVKRLVEPIALWKLFTAERRIEHKADKFFMMRKA
jgi:hypothetical protein